MTWKEFLLKFASRKFLIVALYVGAGVALTLAGTKVGDVCKILETTWPAVAAYIGGEAAVDVGRALAVGKKEAKADE